MSKTVLVLPFVVDETNLQVFLHREVALPQPLPDLLFLGQLPSESLKVLTSERTLFGRFAHIVARYESWSPSTRGPVYDLENDVNYVVLEDGPEPDVCMPFLLERGWSNEPLPLWLLWAISRPRRDPYQAVPDM
ncbi:MAG TPA: hypothetical protein VFZ48_01260 [Candidatus Saccharimonadales bacterium]